MGKTRKNRNSNNITKKQRVFKKGDFYSGDGFLTSVWGPAQWHMLHTISFKDNQVIEYDAKPTKSTMEEFLNTVL